MVVVIASTSSKPVSERPGIMSKLVTMKKQMRLYADRRIADTCTRGVVGWGLGGWLGLGLGVGGWGLGGWLGLGLGVGG
jgi:hypothetical protein